MLNFFRKGTGVQIGLANLKAKPSFWGSTF